MQAVDFRRAKELIPYMTPEQVAELESLIGAGLGRWTPLPGPQMVAYYCPADVLFFGGQAGGTKALPVDTPIPTPDGFRPIGDLLAGDVVFSELGEPVRVVAAHPVLLRPRAFCLEFDDGTKMVACADHRWKTFDAKELAALSRRTPEARERRRAKRERRVSGRKSIRFSESLAKRNSERAYDLLSAPSGTVRSTEQIFSTLRTRTGRANHAILVAQPVQCEDASLAIDPYLLGVWLGDGTSAAASVTTVDEEIREAFVVNGYEPGFVTEGLGKANTYGFKGLKVELRNLGVLGNKHIPTAYLWGSEAQRLALLQGLMDTDGTVCGEGSVSFTTTSSRLADGFGVLVASLGWKCRRRETRARLNGVDCGPMWVFKWTPDRHVFRLARKAQKQRLAQRRTTRFRYVVDCRHAESVPMRCITVDNPTGLYLAGMSFVPTHNTDLLVGIALTDQFRSIIYRREGTQLQAIIDRVTQILGGRDGYNGKDRLWRLEDGRQLEFGGCPNLGDEKRYQGRAHDFKGFDEVTEFLEAQFRFLIGWLRVMGGEVKRKRIVATGNPPTTADGQWVLNYWGPWVNPRHKDYPAIPGELKYYSTVDGEDVEFPDGTPVRVKGELITPLSRTFIPSSVDDNPFLVESGYKAILQALPEPLRSQMLHGDFTAGVQDDPWQVIPTAWVDEAMARWERRDSKGPMDSMGVDVARGGRDEEIHARRHGVWFDELLVFPGSETPDGPTTAGRVIANRRDAAPVHLDVVGWGASPYDHLKGNGVQVVPINGAASPTHRDRSGQLGFVNLRAQLWWQMREDLDPQYGVGVALPPDPKLKADLCAPTWQFRTNGVLVENKEEVKKRIGRSPDRGDAVVMARISTMKTGGPNAWNATKRRAARIVCAP